MSKRKRDEEDIEPRVHVEKKQKISATGSKDVLSLARLGKNCVGEISRFLQPWELLALASAVRHYNKDLNGMLPYIQRLGIISKAIQQQIASLEFADPKLSEIVWESKAVIAGGFLAACLSPLSIKRKWDFSDIDIYLESKDGLLPIDHPIYKLEGWRYTPEPRVPEDKLHMEYRTGTLQNVISNVYTLNGYPTVQIITTTASPIEVVRTFDLDCCKVYFNGRRVTILNPDVFVTRIVPEPATPSDLYFKFKLLTRIRKYEDRGFTIPWRHKTADSRLIVGNQCLFNLFPRDKKTYGNTWLCERRRAVTTCTCLPCTKGNRLGWKDNEPDEFNENDFNSSIDFDYFRKLRQEGKF
jgi:hypothetical protein